MNKPKISVIVPIYNAEKYLGCCINSIIKQSFSDFELLLINDGSIDASHYICEEYAKKDNRIRIINQSNSGVCLTRNKGIEIARGEYIAFCDQDDWFEENALKVLYSLAIKNNSDITCGSIKQVWPHCNVKELLVDKVFVAKVEGNDLYELNKIGASIWGKLYKKEVLEKYNIRLRNVSTREDYIFYYDLLANCKNVATTSQIVYNYNKLENDTGCNNPKIDYCECSILDYESQINANNNWSEDKETINKIIKKITTYHIIDIVNEYLLFNYDNNTLLEKLELIKNKFVHIDYVSLSSESIRVLGFDASSFIMRTDACGLIEMYKKSNNSMLSRLKVFIFGLIKDVCYEIRSKKYKNKL